MKFAYYAHHYALLRVLNAKTIEEKKEIALNYFLVDGRIVDEEMKRKIEEETQCTEAQSE
ncbi:hypothetical protein [Paenibacillus harenae]|uniref:hypothetical protein n=1 Tax=Paenibacillus harenae TaxID=306543 RepID=UPI000404B18D|nr:hypothetical protein [Paenibacillus harenae]